MRYDSPNWSWLHGCSIHAGHVAPCQVCIAEGRPELIRIMEDKDTWDCAVDGYSLPDRPLDIRGWIVAALEMISSKEGVR